MSENRGDFIQQPRQENAGGVKSVHPATLVAQAATRAAQAQKLAQQNARGTQSGAVNAQNMSEAAQNELSRPVPAPPKNSTQSQLPQCAIVFVGPMAAGKTSIGKRVAKELGIPFIDTDSRITQLHGSITEIFARRGEAEFRRIEAEIVAREVSEPGARVVSLGGGALLAEKTREILRQHPVILLMTTEEAVMRTVNLDKRPLLRDDPGAWSRILEARRAIYEEAASVTFHTNRHSKEGITDLIVTWAREQAASALRSQRAAFAARAVIDMPQTALLSQPAMKPAVPSPAVLRARLARLNRTDAAA
ncbi:MAG: shikimate kinase [Microbacteriaceae bacterium]|nr:shikimate kinase [Microbacteriaceae bacterium]